MGQRGQIRIDRERRSLRTVDFNHPRWFCAEMHRMEIQEWANKWDAIEKRYLHLVDAFSVSQGLTILDWGCMVLCLSIFYIF